MPDSGLDGPLWLVNMPDNPLSSIWQDLLGMVCVKGVGFRAERGSQHPAR
jgi:Lhr-like helicase